VSASNEVSASSEVSASNEPNTSLNIFMETFSFYFNTAFALKIMPVKVCITNNWINKVIIISRNEL